MSSKAIAITLVIIAIVALPFFTSPVQPVVWQPSTDIELKGEFTPNQRLQNSERLLTGHGKGPEDFAIDTDGWIYTAFENGDVIKFNPLAKNIDASSVRLINTQGRPLGLSFSPQGDLIIADATLGLLKLDKSGVLTVLVDQFEGQPMKFVDHVDVAQDGTIFFSDASTRFGFHDVLYDFVEASHTGRIFSYNPITQHTELLVDNLFFANGVALSTDESTLYINETGRARILAFDLDLETVSTFKDLPGLPDNLYLSDSGVLWVGLIHLRNPLIDKLAPFPTLRRWVGGLPVALLKPHSVYGMVVGLDENAEVLHNLQTPEGYTQITAALPVGQHLYLGSLAHEAVGKVNL